MENDEKNLLGETSYEFIKKSFELKNSKLYKEAIEMLYKALGCADIGNGATEIISQIGDLYLILKNYERAIEQYEKVLEIDKTHAHSLFQLCEIYFGQKKFDLALGLIKELCKNSPEEENFVRYFKILFELKHFDEINNLYENLNADFKNNPEILYILAHCDNKNEKKMLETIEEIEPNNLTAKFDLGVINFTEKNYEASKKLFSQIIQKSNNSKAHYYLGLINMQSMHYSDAINDFLNAVKFEPNNSIYHFELAKAYAEISWLNEAQICTQKSIELSQDNNDEKYYLLATINWQNKNYKNALLNLEQVTQNNDVLIFKNVIKAQMGDIIEAKTELEKLLSENESNPILLSALGKIYKEMHNIKKAVEIYEKAVSISPNSVEFMGELIDLLVDNKNYDRALKLATELKNLYPEALFAYNSLARIYYRLKKYQNALDELEILLKLNSNDAEANYFAGLILNDMNKPKLAIIKLKNAITLYADSSKYYFQLSRAFELSDNLNDAFLFAKEACMITPHEIAYAKKAYEISSALGLKEEARFYGSQVKILEGCI